MKLGITFVNAGRRAAADDAVALATLAEELGYESLWTVEHTVVPAGYESRYPYDESGRMPGSEDVPIADPLIWMAYVAARTSSIRLATGILILPQRNPLTLAKEVASLDLLSNGRVMLGVGVGWLQEEFDAIGVPFAERGARTDEYVAALREIWRSPEPTFEGRFVSFERAKSYPKPVQDGGVPIVVGGHSEAAARRAGRLGDGFFPCNVGRPEETLRLFDVMREAARDAGRDPGAIELTTGAPTDLDMIKRFADAGVSRLVVPPRGKSYEELKGFLGQIAGLIGSA